MAKPSVDRYSGEGEEVKRTRVADSATVVEEETEKVDLKEPSVD